MMTFLFWVIMVPVIIFYVGLALLVVIAKWLKQ
jgi:hypothetical protein